jgi:hypothetical protein
MGIDVSPMTRLQKYVFDRWTVRRARVFSRLEGFERDSNSKSNSQLAFPFHSLGFQPSLQALENWLSENSMQFNASLSGGAVEKMTDY